MDEFQTHRHLEAENRSGNIRVLGKRESCSKGAQAMTDPAVLAQGENPKVFLSLKVSRQGESCLSDTVLPFCLVGLEFL